MAEEAAEAEGKKSNKLVLIIVVAVVLLLGLGGGAWFFLAGDSTEAENIEEQAAVKQEAIYVKIRTQGGKPYFITNFTGGQTSTQRYMQIYVEARTRDVAVENALTHHMPLIVHSLSLLFSSQTLVDMQTAEGKERLRMQATDKIQEIMQQEIGKPGIEAVYFTNFVMQ